MSCVRGSVSGLIFRKMAPGFLQKKVGEDTEDSKIPPVLTLHIDQGSDGWCAQYFLRSIGIVMVTFPDDSHRRWNNAQTALKDRVVRASVGLHGLSRCSMEARG